MGKRKYVDISSTETSTDEDSDLSKSESLSPPPPKKRKIDYLDIDYKKLTNLDSLIDLIDKHSNVHNYDIIQLQKIIPELLELQNLIGMDDVKKAITYQVLFFIQSLETNDMMHTVIQGPPGCGKTTLAKIIGKIYLKLGFLENDNFIIAKRSDLIGEYLGQTARKTQRIIDKASGGVLFIDEAYSLGNHRNGDSYSKECLDTLNQNLSEKRDFICIIAGYKNDLKKCFFSKNQGLERRFPWIYEIKKYNEKELYNIFVKLVVDSGWNIEAGSIESSFFKKNEDYFPHYGGSLETLIAKIKMIHSQRVFGKPLHLKRILNKEDMDRGLELYLEFQKTKENADSKRPPPGMYV